MLDHILCFSSTSVENLIKFIYLLYLAFLIVVTLLYHPPSSHMIPFLSNVTTFGGMLYIFYDTFN